MACDDIISSYVLRFLNSARKRYFSLISTNQVLGCPTLNQPLNTNGLGKIIIADDVFIGYYPSPYFYSTYAYLDARGASSSIEIKSGARISNNFCAIAEHSSIVIGENCLVGANVTILDSSFHGIAVKDRFKSHPDWAAPVKIGDNVFIGFDVTVLKGVTVGDGSVIGNGSIVTRDIPERVVAAGNPARVLRAITD